MQKLAKTNQGLNFHAQTNAADALKILKDVPGE